MISTMSRPRAEPDSASAAPSANVRSARITRTADLPITSSTSSRKGRPRKCSSGSSLRVIARLRVMVHPVSPPDVQARAKRLDVARAEPPDLRTVLEAWQPPLHRPQAYRAIGDAESDGDRVHR